MYVWYVGLSSYWLHYITHVQQIKHWIENNHKLIDNTFYFCEYNCIVQMAYKRIGWHQISPLKYWFSIASTGMYDDVEETGDYTQVVTMRVKEWIKQFAVTVSGRMINIFHNSHWKRMKLLFETYIKLNLIFHS